MPPTAWANKVSGTLPSDRLRPTARAPTPKATKPAQSKGTELPKSEEVRQLEALLKRIHAPSAGQAQDPKGGCFCQARVHQLSAYTPLCLACGLVLCSLNPPHHSCPSCSLPLFTASSQTSLISRLESEIASTLAKENDARERAADAVRQAAGAFPTLGGGTPPPGQGSAGSSRQPSPGRDAPKVLSLTAKRTKVTVNALGRSPTPSRPASRASGADVEDERRRREEREMGSRIARPPAEVVCAGRKPEPEQPWEDVRATVPVFYVPLEVEVEVKDKTEVNRKKKGKDKSAVAAARSTEAGPGLDGPSAGAEKKGKQKASGS